MGPVKGAAPGPRELAQPSLGGDGPPCPGSLQLSLWPCPALSEPAVQARHTPTACRAALSA